MKLIHFKDDYADIAHMDDFDPKSPRYKRAFHSLYEGMLRANAFNDGSPEARRWKRTEICLTGALILLLAAGALAQRMGILKDLAHPAFIIPAALLIAAILAEGLRFRLYAQRQIALALERLNARRKALSEEEENAILDALYTCPAYLRKRPVTSDAPCGCIRCGALFPARDAAGSGRLICPRCDASREYLVYSDDEVTLTHASIALLVKLFREED